MFSHHKYCPAMPTVDEFWKIAAQVASERGGLVVGFTRDSDQPELGSALDNVFGFAPQSPVTVMSRSDWADWIEQVEAFYRLKPDWGRAKRGTADANYYRVKFEEKFDEFDVPVRPSSSTSSSADSAFSRSLGVPSFGGYAEPLTGFLCVPFGPRCLARVADYLVHRVTSFLAGLLFVLVLSIAAGGRPPAWVLHRISQTGWVGLVTGVLGLFAYHVICTSVHGSTLGKLLFRMQVIQDDGSPCLPKSAIIRELGFFVDGLFFGIIGLFAMGRGPAHKRHGDDWADTIVCMRANLPAASKQNATRFLLGFLLAITADIALLMIGWLIRMNS
jgi:uncharacterized RDD family membrane protein YckC